MPGVSKYTESDHMGLVWYIVLYCSNHVKYILAMFLKSDKFDKNIHMAKLICTL